MFITSRAKFASRRSPNGGAEISTIPRFLRFWHAPHVSPFMLPCVMSRGDLVARWNGIPAIFDPYTFSRTQGQGEPSRRAHGATRLAPIINNGHEIH
jgi:hypothetical protein